MIMQNLEKLQQLIDFEKQTVGFVSEPHPNKTVEVKVTNEKIYITIDGNQFVGISGRGLIHKLGNGIFKTIYKYEQIEYVWNKMLKKGEANILESKIQNYLRYKPLTIKYYIEHDGTKKIYGIHTDKFIDVNQFEFREEFISVAKETNLLEDKSKFGIDPYGNIIEMFPTRFNNDTTDYECILKYGRNNGYSAYKVNYGRIIIVCTNGLIDLGSSEEYKWHHTKKEPIETFVNRVLLLGKENQVELEAQMEEAANRTLYNEELQEFLDGFKTSLENKAKIKEQLTIESELVGASEWALSQSLTHLATHDETLGDKAVKQFAAIGTKMIHTPLKVMIKEREEWNKKYKVATIAK